MRHIRYRTPHLLLHTLWAVLVALLPFTAAAQGLAPGDARAVRTIIEAQLDAFQRDDAPRAFSFAADGIARFRNGGVVHRDGAPVVPVVYRPKSVQFEAPVLIEGRWCNRRG